MRAGQSGLAGVARIDAKRYGATDIAAGEPVHGKRAAGEPGDVPGKARRAGVVVAQRLVMLETLTGMNSQDRGRKDAAWRVLYGSQTGVFVANGAASDQNSPIVLQRLQKSQG